ncbi:DUF7824 domain-containing protein [Streptomyces antimicrobicus]|uniref:DUF6493 family protein n=1 Tax=Streptomyces antimicrobicus TaxID=2883108 RepID=A0ABS8BEI2_9ACTN|nr:DUF6493 family protein [Streptomyces antimicrobicus]MCB5182934.1 DUF6493 family protein [Streptomyces antimicrobicus]
MTTTTTAGSHQDAAVRHVLDAVRAGRDHELPGLVGPLDPPARRALLAELKALRAEARGWEWDRWRERDALRAGLLVAGAACHTGAAAAAAWIGARDLRRWPGLPTDLLLDVLADRDPAWLGDVARRLADRAATAADDYAFISGLLRISGGPVPTTDAFVHGWVDSKGITLDLHDDPYAPELVPRLFETAEPAPALLWRAEPDNPEHWPSGLVSLAEAGVVERRTLVDGCTARLLRGGRPQQLSFYLVLLRRLELTAAEEQERAADWIAMAADGPAPVAGHAQEVLARLALAGALTAGQLAEMSSLVLFRPEKKFVRAQLVLLGKVLRRDPDARHELLPAVAGAFGHEDTALQERALKLVAAHLKPQDEALREELADQARALSPVHRPLAVTVLGAGAAGDPGEADLPYEELLPHVPVRRRLGATPSVAETVELVVAVGKARTPDLTEFERALDGLVRHARLHRAELAEALRPALAGRWWIGSEAHAGRRPAGLDVVAAAVLGLAHPSDLRIDRQRPSGHHHRDCVHEALGRVLDGRLREAGQRILEDPLPFLLATPSWDTGSLEPDELTARLAQYRQVGVRPAPHDFAQALLRVRRDPAAAAAAAALDTSEGRRLARWLGSDGEPAAAIRRVREPGERAVHWWERAGQAVRRIVVETGDRLLLQREFPAAFHPLGRPQREQTRCYHWTGEAPLRWAVLPEDRETQAAWMLPALTGCAVTEERGAAAELPRLAELGGPAGPALHLAVATGLGARHGEDRLSAVDALLLLAARGELDAPRLGRDLAELLSLGTVKPTRLADALRTAASTGAYATTWAVLAEALPTLLEDPAAHRGTGELLSVAADCVERTGATGPLPPGLADLATRRGTTQLLTQAARLHTALTPPPPTTDPEIRGTAA